MQSYNPLKLYSLSSTESDPLLSDDISSNLSIISEHFKFKKDETSIDIEDICAYNSKKAQDLNLNDLKLTWS